MKKTFAYIIIFTILLVVVGILFKNSYKQTKQPSASNYTEATEWNTYRNGNYGFEFKIPPGWSIDDKDPYIRAFFGTELSWHSLQTVFIRPYANEILKGGSYNLGENTNVESLAKKFRTDYSDSHITLLQYEERPISIKGKKALQIYEKTRDNTGMEEETYNTLIPYENSIISVFINWREKPADVEKFVETYTQILYTFSD